MTCPKDFCAVRLSGYKVRACNSFRSDTFWGLCLPDDRHHCREAATVTASAWSHLANKVSQLTEHVIDGGMSSTIMADHYISFASSSASKQKDRNEKLFQSSRFRKPWLWKSRVIFPINRQFMSSQELSKKSQHSLSLQSTGWPQLVDILQSINTSSHQ